MGDGDVCIFVSYAHDDDLPTSPMEGDVGFVSFFCKWLSEKLKEIGAANARLWVDRRRVDKAAQFDDVIDDGLRTAEILIVVMSPNWMRRPYCAKELEAFAELRRKAGVSSVRERMIVVGKGHVDRLKRPFDLQGQEGFLFYARDDANNVENETPFYVRGNASEAFFKLRDELAAALKRRVDLIAQGKALGSALPPNQPILAPNGRIVYLAKPATDMKAAYQRLAFELQGKGFSVVPDVSTDLPSDAAALAAVRDALAKAETSVHLVGEKPGFAPEGLDPIVRLQLALARDRAAAPAGGRAFRRIVWAPKVLVADEAAAAPVAERDPFEALARFDTQTATDKIDGGILNRFVESLFQYLADSAPRQAVDAAAGSRIEVFLSYDGADEDYAEKVADAIRGESVKIRLPSMDAEPVARRFNEDLLTKCDAVTVCWANATETWVRSQADRLKDWQALGRKQQFVYRSLIAGPPPAPHKKPKLIDLVFQDGEFDTVVDLVEKGPPTRELLARLAPGGGASP